MIALFFVLASFVVPSRSCNTNEIDYFATEGHCCDPMGEQYIKVGNDGYPLLVPEAATSLVRRYVCNPCLGYYCDATVKYRQGYGVCKKYTMFQIAHLAGKMVAGSMLDKITSIIRNCKHDR